MSHILWRHFLGSHLRSRSWNMCTLMQCSKTTICWRNWKHFQPVAWSDQDCLKRIQSRKNQFSSQWIEWVILRHTFLMFWVTISHTLLSLYYMANTIWPYTIWPISYGSYGIDHMIWAKWSNYDQNKFILVNFNANKNLFAMLNLMNRLTLWIRWL